MQTRSSDENSVRLSVRLVYCLSNAWIVTKWKRKNSPDFYALRKIIYGKSSQILLRDLHANSNV